MRLSFDSFLFFTSFLFLFLPKRLKIALSKQFHSHNETATSPHLSCGFTKVWCNSFLKEVIFYGKDKYMRLRRICAGIFSYKLQTILPAKSRTTMEVVSEFKIGHKNLSAVKGITTLQSLMNATPSLQSFWAYQGNSSVKSPILWATYDKPE